MDWLKTHRDVYVNAYSIDDFMIDKGMFGMTWDDVKSWTENPKMMVRLHLALLVAHGKGRQG